MKKKYAELGSWSYLKKCSLGFWSGVCLKLIDAVTMALARVTTIMMTW